MKSKLLSFALAVLTVGLLGSCSKINERIDGLDKRIYDLENSKIASVQQQIVAINASIDDLKAADAAIGGKIEELKGAADAQQALIDALKEADIALGQKDAALEARIATLEGKVTTINGQITALEAADNAINARIDALETYVDAQIGDAKDWATATFATLTEYDKTAKDVAALSVAITGINSTLTEVQASIAGLGTKIDGIDAALQSKIEAAKTELGDKIASLKTDLEGKIADAIKVSETTIQGWVNEQLSGYYTAAQVEAEITDLQNQINTLKTDTGTNKAKIVELEAKLATLANDLKDAKDDIKAEYEAAIKTAIEENNGVINQTIQTKINEVNATITALTGRVDALEATVGILTGRIDEAEASIATIKQQITAINASIDDLKAADAAIGGKIEELKAAADAQQALIDALKEADKALEQKDAALEARIATLEGKVTTINSQIKALEAADNAINARIDALETYVDAQIVDAKDWATATFATLIQYEQTADDLAALSVTVENINTALTAVQASIAALDAKIAGIDAALQSKIAAAKADLEVQIKALKQELEGEIASKISASETNIQGWVNGQLTAYYTKAEMDAKIQALKAQIEELKADTQTNKNKIANLEAKLAELATDLNKAMKAIKDDYMAAITDAINNYNGIITNTIQDAINEVNGKIDALTGRVDALENDIDNILEDIDAIKEMIQAVGIIPAYTDGSVAASGTILTIKCIVEPAAAVTDITEDDIQILISQALTKAASYEAVAVSVLDMDSETGELSIKADISSITPAPNGMALMAAVKIDSGLSQYITNFYPVYTKPNEPDTSGDPIKVTISPDDDFPFVNGIFPVNTSFNSSKSTAIEFEGIGTITFNKEAAAKIQENAEGATSILIKVEDVTNTLPKPIPDADVVIEVTMKTFDEFGNEVFSESNAGGVDSEATIEIGMGSEVAFVKTVTLVDEKGNPIPNGVVPGSEKVENGILSFKVNHFSKYAVDYVLKKDFISVTGVSLDKNSMALAVGENETLTATTTPENATNKNVTWTSSNEDVATVEGGKVTAKAVGSTTITVTTDDGSKTATCIVTVTQALGTDSYGHVNW